MQLTNKLKEILNSYFWLIAVGFLIFVGVMTYLIFTDWQDGATERTVTVQTNESNKAVREAVNAQNGAVNTSIERRTEDATRERILKPKLDDARRQSQSSKTALDAAQKTYNAQKSNTANLSANRADNCRELQRLFSNVRFADCE